MAILKMKKIISIFGPTITPVHCSKNEESRNTVEELKKNIKMIMKVVMFKYV